MLLAATGLVAVSCWLGTEFRIDEPGVQIARIPRIPNSRGESIRGALGLTVYDTRSEKLFWRVDTTGQFQFLVGDHYMVGLRSGRIEVIDIDDALAAPIDERKVRHFEFESFGIDVRGLNPAQTESSIHAIPGGNRFILQMRSEQDSSPRRFVFNPLSTAYLYEIESRSIRLLTSWPCQKADVAVLPDGRVLSVAPRGGVVELRSPHDFQIESQRAFPVGLNDWQAIIVRNHLFSYLDENTGFTCVCRLDDFSELAELKFPLVRKSATEIGEDRRFHILSDGTLPKSRRLVVYDTTSRRIAFDSGAANGFRSADVRDGQLRLTNLAFGLTTLYYDLQSGQCVRVERPFLWIIVAMPVVLLAGLAWLSVWITKLPCSTRLIPWNIALVATMFLTPLVWRTGRWGFAHATPRPTIEFSLSVVLALSFCLALFAAFGRWRWLLRVMPFLMGLAALFAYVHYFKLVDFNRDNPYSPAVLSLRIWITFSILSALTLGALRMAGCGIVNSKMSQPVDGRGAHIHLLDIFLMTAVVASMLTVFVAHVDLLISPTGAAFVLASSAMLTVVACLGLLALVENSRLHRLANILAILVALMGIVEIVVHVSCAHRASELWYRMASDCRYPIFTALCVFAFCSIMRSADLRLKRVAS